MTNKVSNQIIKGTQKAGKNYVFNDTHDSSQPADLWFQESNEGLILFIVFYSQACRWSRCLGCNLPALMSSHHVPFKDIMSQTDNIFKQDRVWEKRNDIRKVIVSNNGSILDQDTFSSTALMYLLAKLNLHLPNLAVLSIETRPEYVDFSELDFISRALDEGDSQTHLEIAIGFEAFDDHIRNDIFDKGLSLKTFEELAKTAAPFGYHLKTYFMQKPVPKMTDEEAVEDIHNAIDYLADVIERYNIPINMHLNPTYVARGTRLENIFTKGEYNPPYLKDIAKAALKAKGKAISVYIGLSDEGLATPGGSFIREGEEQLLKDLELFNKMQDYRILEKILNH